jgi:glycosyltransferase involved in cell wall biosynthesis
MDASPPLARQRLVVHLVHRLDTSGLDTGLLNLIRHMPPGRYRHAIVCLKDNAGQGALFRHRDVEVITLSKREGKDFAHYLRLFRTLRALHPDVIHTRNLSGIEAQLVAALAGVKLRVHGEHAGDDGAAPVARLRYRLLRRLLRPLIGHFIAASPELAQWLVDSVGAQPDRVSRIPNGVDSIQFHPRLGPKAAIGPPGFVHDHTFVIGGAGPMDEHAQERFDQ